MDIFIKTTFYIIRMMKKISAGEDPSRWHVTSERMFGRRRNTNKKNWTFLFLNTQFSLWQTHSSLLHIECDTCIWVGGIYV